jgi:type II restriction enzyme
LTPIDPVNHEYELLEIPVQIFEQTRAGEVAVSTRSRQIPPVARCVVSDDVGTAFEFYYDGGTEMKLQLKGMRKDLCILHATWSFTTTAGTAVDEPT